MKDTAEATNAYAAKVIYGYLSAMQAEVEGVRTGADNEYIHRMRVATRRLRSALRIFRASFPRQEYKQYTKDIRAVTKALGEARDLDVHLELLEKLPPQFLDPPLSPGINRLRLRLKQQRQQSQSSVIEAMTALEEDQTLRKIARWASPWLQQSESFNLYSPHLYKLAFSSIKTRLEEMMVFDQSVRYEVNVSELHAMRISAKRLRYTMEVFQDLYGEGMKPFINQTKKLQDLLGSIHDADVWIELIPNFIKEEQQRIQTYFGHTRPLRRLLPGLNALSANRKSDRDEDYASFIQEWDKTLESGLWEKLGSLINAPLDIEEEIQLLPKTGSPDQQNPSQPPDL